MNARGRLGGLLGLKGDFEVCDKLLQRIRENMPIKRILLILKAIQLLGDFLRRTEGISISDARTSVQCEA